jgi:hypothetical protein
MMTFFAWPVVGLVWLLDRLRQWRRARSSTPPLSPRPVVHRARPLTDTEVQHRHAMTMVQRERNDRMQEAQAITELLRTIDTAGYPFKWGQAQALAADELGTHDGLVYWERARLRFIELGGGEVPPHVPAVVVPELVATVPAADALAPEDEAIAARLLGWLDTGQ